MCGSCLSCLNVGCWCPQIEIGGSCGFIGGWQSVVRGDDVPLAVGVPGVSMSRLSLRHC